MSPMMKRAVALTWILLMLFPQGALAKSNIFLDVEPMYQVDYPNTLFQFEGEDRSVKSSGCGAVCVSMVLHFLSPEVEQTPETLLLWAYESQLYQGHGLTFEAITKMLTAYGLEGQWVGKAPKTIRQALRDGSPVIAYMGEGIFTSGGHYILIYGIDRNDRVRIVDPNSKTLSDKWFSIKILFNQAGNNHSFLICRKPEDVGLAKTK